LAQQILQTLLFNIESNTAQLKQGLDQAKNQISSFGKGVSQIGNLLKGAFAATAIIGAVREVFNFGQELEGVRDKIENLGYTMDTAFSTGKAKAIADVFEVDIDKVITAANATAKQFGINFNDALTLTQQGLALAGTESLKYLKAIEANASAYSTAGGTAEQYFAVVTNGFATSSKWEDQIKNGVTDIGVSFTDLTSKFTESQLVQQRLIVSTAELNTVFTNLFDGSGDGLDKLKTTLNEIAVASIKGIKTGIIEVSNYFISLYNNSILFRGIIEAVVLNFKIMWNAVKAVGTALYDVFSNTGLLLKAILTGNFSVIPDIIRKGFTDVVANAKQFGENTATSFKEAAQAIFDAKPIALISETESINQGIIAGKAIQKGINSVRIIATVNPRSNISTNSISDIKLEQPDSINKKELNDSLSEISAQTGEVQTQWNELDSQFKNTLGGTLVDGLDAAGGAISGFGDDASTAFEKFFGSVLAGIKGIINNLLAVAVAGMIAGESSKGIVGLALASLGIAAITALFNSQVNSKVGKYANGTNNASGGLSLVGERGRELVNLPSGSRVSTNFQTERLLGGVQAIEVHGMVSGENIYFSNKEVARRRGNSI
jgi:hypothetical protein